MHTITAMEEDLDSHIRTAAYLDVMGYLNKKLLAVIGTDDEQRVMDEIARHRELYEQDQIAPPIIPTDLSEFGNPSITFFKQVYRHHTNFSVDRDCIPTNYQRSNTHPNMLSTGTSSLADTKTTHKNKQNTLETAHPRNSKLFNYKSTSRR